ncbi:response regulator receiver protein [Sulfuricurvum kujiense DSM 16994]|uniref:Response regulator receiver protein n=1 Tax=Sulfuricurvum kujiense (strain ATCC BAA-921 / DSM 16994 / JCM 11577 / YK-1) TaxID=709032 RepID=E4TZP4_SULKY|nr:response regulator [Sulfuricurvum kujiense]ADR34151.1 response regulator receiver protein [Sulfuricurvum kujiense DSM 16994]
MLNILVVDDSLIMRRNIIKMIESLGHKVVGEAKDGQEAVEVYRKLKPDLVTMDITMPRMDGLGAVKELKKIDKNAKIIMVTSHGQEEMVIDAIRSGASGYLLKPVKINKLSDSIQKIFPSMIDQTVSEQKETTLLESEEILLPEIEDLA